MLLLFKALVSPFEKTGTEEELIQQGPSEALDRASLKSSKSRQVHTGVSLSQEAALTAVTYGAFLKASSVHGHK